MFRFRDSAAGMKTARSSTIWSIVIAAVVLLLVGLKVATDAPPRNSQPSVISSRDDIFGVAKPDPDEEVSLYLNPFVRAEVSELTPHKGYTLIAVFEGEETTDLARLFPGIANGREGVGIPGGSSVRIRITLTRANGEVAYINIKGGTWFGSFRGKAGTWIMPAEMEQAVETMIDAKRIMSSTTRAG